MKCPHCNTGIYSSLGRYAEIVEPQAVIEGKLIAQQVWQIMYQRCPECYGSIIFLERRANQNQKVPDLSLLAFPRSSVRPVPSEVTDPYRQDFLEACTVLPFSSKASAALSRRCLQAILRDKAGTSSKDLYDQIEELIKSGTIPSHIAQDLHTVRVIGNIAAHSLKSTATGAIVDVEVGEAEWNLDILELLFDFYFVQPAISAKRKADLNRKLTEAGKQAIP